MTRRHTHQQGLTLVELVITIVVLGVGVAASLAAILQGARYSAHPMLEQQGNAIARAYLEEILQKPFCDPNDFSTACASDCTSAACTNCSGATVDGVTVETRATFDDVCDYNGLNDAGGAVDQNGTAIAGLGDYSVRATVSEAATLNGLNAANGQVLRVDVSVTHATIGDISLSGFRGNY